MLYLLWKKLLFCATIKYRLIHHGEKSMYIFISHSSANYQVAEEVCNLIEKSGKQCFIAPRDIRSGYEYAEEILNGIERSDVMVLLLSKEANESPHVLREVERAVSKRIPLIVYKLEEVQLSKSMEYFLMSHQWVSAKPGVGHEEIVKCLDVFAERKAGYEEEKAQGEQETSQPQGLKKPVRKRILFAGLAIVLLLTGLLVWRIFTSKEEGGESPEALQAGPATEEKQNIARPVDLGDTIVLGSYNGELIEWRVIKLSEDKSSAVVLASNIITMKAFDVAESGSYNHYNSKDYWGEDISNETEEIQKQLRGNNDWAQSNIRTWLNSTAENVVYEDQAPTQTAMSEYKNGYDKERGFLNNFSEEECAAILVTDVETNGRVTQDKVYLLSSEELQWLAEADVSLAAMPTEAALEQDASNWYEVYVSGYGVEDYFWWLRDHAESGEEAAPYNVYLVSFSYTGNEMVSEGVDGEGFGVRPAMTIDMTADCIEVK